MDRPARPPRPARLTHARGARPARLDYIGGCQLRASSSSSSWPNPTPTEQKRTAQRRYGAACVHAGGGHACMDGRTYARGQWRVDRGGGSGRATYRPADGRSVAGIDDKRPCTGACMQGRPVIYLRAVGDPRAHARKDRLVGERTLPLAPADYESDAASNTCMLACMHGGLPCKHLAPSIGRSTTTTCNARSIPRHACIMALYRAPTYRILSAWGMSYRDRWYYLLK